MSVWALRTLAAVEQQLEDLADKFVTGRIDARQHAEKRSSLQWERRRLLGGGLASRPPRRMPSLPKIARIHGLGDWPHCVRCGYSMGGTWRTASSWLDRAHVIDRCFDGLDVPANLRPLCTLCHRYQPIFKPGQEAEALAWFTTNPTALAASTEAA